MTTVAPFVPSDQAVRDAVRDGIGENMCVEAGAGTGKTTVLVDRIVQIIRSGRARVQDVAVITFTEKAAAELAARVRERLEIAREDAACPPDERARFDAALRDLSRAHMETIHAFAAALLRERPVEAGIDPGFQVLADLPAQLAFETAYNDWISEELAGATPPAALLGAMNIGLDYKDVREAAEALQRHRDLLPLQPFAHPDPDIAGMLRTITTDCETLRDCLPHVVNPADKALEAARDVVEMQRAFEALRGRPESLRHAIAAARPSKGSMGNQGNWRTPQHCRDVKQALKSVCGAIEACSDAMKQAASAELLVWLQSFVRMYDARRKAAGQADFDDLLIWARDLVRDNVEVRRYFADQYACVLVDEFQDTDPLQAELIIWLCADRSMDGASGVAADWRRASLRPGSLFVVGDPKQSIYRFRRADIGMYDEVKAHIFGGDVRRIVQNFRSAGPIIDWVNSVFGTLISEAPGVQPEYVPLSARPEYADAAGDCMEVVECVVPPASKKASTASELRVAESNAVASIIARAVAEHAWPLRSGAAATFRDIAVLIPSRAELATYEDALARANVPYRHEGGRTFFQRQEVRELIAVLRAIDDPADNVAEVAALRSSGFALSDEDLLLGLTRSAGAGDSANERAQVAAQRVRAARALLAELRALRHAHILPDIVRTVLDRTQLVESAMLQPQGEQVAANLLKLVDQARQFAAAGGGGLRGFVRWLKENTARTSDETDAAISEETDDVVRVVTVHASKGLEFPVVVFANMGTNRADRTRVIADRAHNAAQPGAGGRLHARFGKAEARFNTPGWDGALAAERVHDDAEQCRLLYVAATRAQDRLVVPMFVASAAVPAWRDVKSANDLLRQADLTADAVVTDGATIEAPAAELPLWRREPAAATDAAGIARVVAERDGWGVEHALLIAEASAPLDVRTATSLKAEWQGAGGGDEIRRGRATEFGSAVHALLERIDFARPEDAAAMAPAVAAEFGLRGREREIASVAEKALRSDVIRRALASPRVLREVAFTAPLPAAGDDADGWSTGLAEGRIDLLFVEDAPEGGGIVIVDFKTDAVSAKDIEARAAHYRNQMLVYAWAAEQASGMPVREVVFLFARPDIEHATAVDTAFRAEAEALLSAPATPDAVPPATD